MLQIGTQCVSLSHKQLKSRHVDNIYQYKVVNDKNVILVYNVHAKYSNKQWYDPLTNKFPIVNIASGYYYCSL